MRPTSPRSRSTGSASRTRLELLPVVLEQGLARERSSRLPRIVNRSEIICWAASGLPAKRLYGLRLEAGGTGSGRLPGHHPLGAALRPPLEPRELRVAQELLERRPAVAARRRAGRPGSRRAWSPTPRPRSRTGPCTRSVIVETTPSRPRLGRHRVEQVGVRVLARELVDVAAPVDDAEAVEVAVGGGLSEPPDEPVAVKPLIVWWVMPPVLVRLQPFWASAEQAGLERRGPVGSLGSAPRWMPAWASTSLRGSSLTRQPR